MAEYVYQNLEDMLPELEEMERVGIFSKQEIKSIVKRRTALEYKLQRKITQEVDFLRYIQYELNLDLLRKKRKRKCGIQQNILPGEAVFIRRLHQLFQNALKRFPSDVKLWLQYIDYCKRVGSNQVLGKVVGRMLQAHPNNTGLWVMAAKWEFEDKSNIKTARSLLQRALRLNPSSCDLWLEYFRLELLHIDKVKKRRHLLGLDGKKDDDPNEPSSTEFLSGKTARIVYKNAIHNIPGDIQFHLKFVDIYNLFDETDEGVDEIFQSLLQDFPNSELYWNALAHRGFNEMKTSSKGDISGVKRLELETERNQVFEKAVKQVPTETMWGYYIDACMNDLRNSASNKTIDSVLQLFKSAAKVNKLTVDKYQLWVETLVQNGNSTEAIKVCKVSLKNAPNSHSVSLWLQYFKLKITEGPGFTSSLLGEFSQALKQVDCQGVLCLWNLWLEHSMFLNLPETEKIFQECMLHCRSGEVKAKIKETYVEVIVIKHGIKKGRKVYQRLSQENPISISFFDKCIAAENSQITPSLKHLRQLYETALGVFGSVSPGLWLDYIRLELHHGNSEVVGKLHWKAMKTLSGDNIQVFITKYTLLLHS